MIISHKYKFIFVRTQKTASSSIMNYLYNYLDEDDICTGDGPDGIPVLGITTEQKTEITKNYNNHLGWQWIEENYTYEWNNYYRFSLERNPWDKVVSFYYRFMHLHPRKTKNGFEDFCKRHIHKISDWNLYADDNTIVVDSVFQYENLHNEFDNSSIIPYNGELLYTWNKSQFRPNKEYTSFYNGETNKLVESTFHREINFFNYKF